MASPKTAAAGKKKRVTRGSSSHAPQPDYMEAEFMENYDQHRFSSEDAAERFVEIMSRSLIPERKVKLNPGEYDEFRLKLERRNWHRVLGDLPNEIDETLVKEFYTNAYQQVRNGPRQAKVRGKTIKYDRRTLNTFLRTTCAPPGQDTPYSAFMSCQKDFDEIASVLCLLGHTFVLGVNGTPVRLLRKHLTSLAQMWSAFSYTNLRPNTHTSDLNLERSYLIFGIITGLDMDVGALISHDIAYTADAANVNLGFPAIITTLCREKGLVSDVNVLLSLAPPLDKKFFHKNCTNRAVDAPAPTPARQPHCSQPISADFEATFQATMAKMFAKQDDMWSAHNALHRGQVSIMDSMYQVSLGMPDFPDDAIMTGTQFEEYIPWPEGRPAS
ncbi:hypothetical protein DEO72_LG5g2018 [Vigna unguiculata]|uniref:Putative plant transposon protein domain-containing protein n=1 Tax=Vigna unguiculata TaxID=3917 RepID=A0A4D6M026_VIGUN|nr:hypothetical protein DEO72_LG5g2018 [Vigna unguiculata]